MGSACGVRKRLSGTSNACWGVRKRFGWALRMRAWRMRTRFCVGPANVYLGSAKAFCRGPCERVRGECESVCVRLPTAFAWNFQRVCVCFFVRAHGHLGAAVAIEFAACTSRSALHRQLPADVLRRRSHERFRYRRRLVGTAHAVTIPAPAPARSVTPDASTSPEQRAWFIAALLYLVLALLLTWPLAPQAATHLPIGRLPDATVPLFNLWTLEWNVDRLLHGYAQYWNAPLFFPVTDTFALSEPQGLTGLWFALLRLGLAPVAAYNATLVSLLILNGLCMRRLVRVVGCSSLVATLAGALMVGAPVIRSESGVLQLCAAFPVLLGLSEIAQLSAAIRPAPILRLGLWFVASLWTCVYYALFFALLLSLAGLFLLSRALLRPRSIAASLAAFAFTLVLAWPLLAAQHRALANYTRSEETIHSGSASALAYLQFPLDTPLGRLVPAWARAGSRRSLYPGAILCGLALLGLIHERRRVPARFLRYCIVAALLCLFLSFGTRLRIGDLSPYAATAERYLPGFAQLRSPYRAHLFVEIFLIVFAALGLEWSRRARWRALPLVCVALALFEVTPWGMPLSRFPAEVLREPWIAELAGLPPGAAIMLPPVPAHHHVADYIDSVLGMLAALRHRHPIVNGYSGFFPDAPVKMLTLVRDFPSLPSLRLLRWRKVRYVVVDWRRVTFDRIALARWPDLHEVYASPPRSIYELDPTP
jgi:hypothetical protein